MTALIYSDFKDLATDLLKELGEKVTVSRAGTTVGTGHGVFTGSSSSAEGSSSSSNLASTEITTRSMVLSSAFEDIRVGDNLVADKKTHTITSVSRKRPTDLTIAWQVEVV
jgi:hypothetical protein